MLKLETVFKVRVIYKSGATQDFETLNFSLTKAGDNSKAEWHAVGRTRPIIINVDEIESAWQIGFRKRIAWGTS